MGYGYGGTGLVVFLTHPGVVIPTISSITSLIPTGALPGPVQDLIPSGGFPPILSGLWQLFWAWALGSAGNGSEGLAWTMAILYSLFLFLYVWFGVLATRMTFGV
jgi:hypothetical protein